MSKTKIFLPADLRGPFFQQQPETSTPMYPGPLPQNPPNPAVIEQNRINYLKTLPQNKKA